MNTFRFETLPLMPKVGPCEGCLKHTKASLFLCMVKACAKPIDVVLFPSPSGVGVILMVNSLVIFKLCCGCTYPATTMYFPFLRFRKRSSTDRATFAFLFPYGDNSTFAMPTSLANCEMSLGSCERAICMSLQCNNFILLQV